MIIRVICFDLCTFSEILTWPNLIQALLQRKKDKDEIVPCQHKISKDWIIFYGIFPSQHKICKDRQRSGGLCLQYISFHNVSITIYISRSFWFQFLSRVEKHNAHRRQFHTFCFTEASISINQSNHMFFFTDHLDCGAHTICSKSSFFGQS